MKKSIGFAVVLLGVVAHDAGRAEMTEPVKWQAQWIFRPAIKDDYNCWMLARRQWDVQGTVQSARLVITADTRYQVFINGEFVGDGPVRAFPEHYRYDVVEVSSFLRPGANVIGIRVHHWGRDTAESIAVQPGLLVQLDWTDAAGQHVLATDRAWQVCDDPAHNPRSPIVSAHLGFEEQYDARQARADWLLPNCAVTGWQAAVEIAPALAGPWKDLQSSGIPPLEKEIIRPLSVMDVQRVRAPRMVSTINLGHCQGIARKADCRNAYRFVLVTELVSEKEQNVFVGRPSAAFEFGKYCFNGQTLDVERDLLQQERATVHLQQGANPLIVVLDDQSEAEEFQFVLDAEAPVTLRNPFGKGPWGVAGSFQPKDQTWRKLRAATTLVSLQPFRQQFRDLEPREVITTDVHGLTCFRKVLGQGTVVNPQGLVFDNAEVTTIPAGSDDIELIIDLGLEYNAHLGFEICAPAGVVLDANIFERFHGGAPQWSWRNRSSFRYITRDGWQSYMTMRHFGGRYVALTVRARTADVKIRCVYGHFTHYPVADRGAFASSDALLNNVWRISRQTMLSCMEDTFVDCPLYEQSFWLGDARNEALVCYMMFGDARLVRRCCLLGGQSLERDDLVHMRIPTRWGRIIPAWSFLWARMCWENYWYTGDRETLRREYYPALRRMLDACLTKYLDPKTGLFSIAAWQFFDWIGLDNNHHCVTHNNTFLVDTLRLGARMAEVAQDAATAARFRSAADQLAANINRHLWDEKRGAYIDSIHNDGKRSTSVSRQINTLALLHGVVPPERQQRVMAIALGQETNNVVQFGSPFATLYLLELLGETGRIEPMLGTIRDLWGGMMDGQTTTFWESFANGNLGGGRYPTRSYCHAWSAGPAYILSRYVLGVRLDEPGGQRVTVCPQLDSLERAEGVTPLPSGKLMIQWQRQDRNHAVLTLRLDGDFKAHLQPPPNWQIDGNATVELQPQTPQTFKLTRQP